MKYVVETISDGVIHLPNSMTIGSDIEVALTLRITGGFDFVHRPVF
jgi:hypothetical protein